jgi:hypothetical protein
LLALLREHGGAALLGAAHLRVLGALGIRPSEMVRLLRPQAVFALTARGLWVALKGDARVRGAISSDADLCKWCMTSVALPLVCGRGHSGRRGNLSPGA